MKADQRWFGRSAHFLQHPSSAYGALTIASQRPCKAGQLSCLQGVGSGTAAIGLLNIKVAFQLVTFQSEASERKPSGTSGYGEPNACDVTGTTESDCPASCCAECNCASSV